MSNKKDIDGLLEVAISRENLANELAARGDLHGARSMKHEAESFLEDAVELEAEVS